MTSWRREGATGRLRSPFDLDAVDNEEAPRGPVDLRGRRGTSGVQFVLPQADFGLSTRPWLPAPQAARYEEGRGLLARGQAAGAAQVWDELAGQLADEGRRTDAAWLLTRVARARLDAEPAEGRAALGRARGLVAGHPSGEAAVAFAAGILLDDANQTDAALQAFQEALDAFSKSHPRSLRRAAALGALAYVTRRSGDNEGAERLYRQALALRRELVPDSLEVASTLNNLGITAWNRGNLDEAERLYDESLQIVRRRAPSSTDVADTLNNLSLAARDRGDLATAESRLREALGLREKLAPGSRDLASTVLNLGAIASDRGDLESAEGFATRALALFEKLAPGSLEVSITLNNLGTIARDRGDLEAAEGFFRRSLAMRRKLAPRSLDVATSLSNLGGLLLARGKLSEAEALHRESLELRRSLAPDSVAVAISLEYLAAVAQARGDHPSARRMVEEALAIQQQLVPGSGSVAQALEQLGELAWAQGDAAEAERLHRQALALRTRLTPGTSSEAHSWHALGLVLRSTGRPALAAEHFRSAVAALEAQQGRLGEPEDARSAFVAGYADYYRNLIDVLVDLGRSAEAFHVLEQSRARSLLAMLAERDLVFSGELPDAIAREQRRTGAEYDRTQAGVAQLNPATDGKQIDRLLRRLGEIRARRLQIAGRIREASPRLGSLKYPRPLDLEAAREALDPGTLLLAYSVGRQGARLFVLRSRADSRGPDDRGLSVYALPWTEETLRSRVRLFRGLIERGRRAPDPEPALLTQGARLYADLVQPAEDEIVAARRVLILPDGPLHGLPFAALVRARVPLQYLAEWKPLHSIVSATVYAELKRARRSRPTPGALELVAFGDPLPSARGLELGRLAASRSEVVGIAALFPGRTAVHLAGDATEARALALGTGVRYVHFATHGLLDPRLPLSSALVLTASRDPAAGDGLLHAWEVFEGLRLDADLVTLSACESLGHEQSGEGLMGLTRAFQYAGARSVVASLWAISDTFTAELMKRFYGFLRAGQTKDEALRSAQEAMIHGPLEGRHPLHWAAFQVIGDWR